MSDEVKLSDEQKEAVEKGKRIGFLIAALDLPDEEKETMLTLLREMDQAQLDTMLSALERNYLIQSDKLADAELQTGLKKVEREYEAKIAAAQNKATEELTSLEKTFNQLK